MEELPDEAYISVDIGNLYFAWRTIFPVDRIGMPAKDAEWTKEKTLVSVRLIRSLIHELVNQDRVNDPSVGIFDYDLQPCLQMLTAWLHGKDICPRCGGEGFFTIESEDENGERFLDSLPCETTVDLKVMK